MRLLPSALLATTVAAGALFAGAPAASAEGDAYQYWGYYQVKDGAFTYASKGAADVVPADGSIEGHRWAASPMGQMNAPRADLTKLTFDAICGDDEAAEGDKRVAVIVDFGPEGDALEGDSTPEPYADCAVVPEKATGLQVLEAVADVRTAKSSMGVSICGIDGYPSTTCADGTTSDASAPDKVVEIAVKGEEPAASAGSNEAGDSNTSLLVGGGILVALLVLLGGVIALRRKA
jgi:LPXTG-motif cell wall-anchored protein